MAKGEIFRTWKITTTGKSKKSLLWSWCQKERLHGAERAHEHPVSFRQDCGLEPCSVEFSHSWQMYQRGLVRLKLRSHICLCLCLMSPSETVAAESFTASLYMTAVLWYRCSAQFSCLTPHPQPSQLGWVGMGLLRKESAFSIVPHEARARGFWWTNSVTRVWLWPVTLQLNPL